MTFYEPPYQRRMERLAELAKATRELADDLAVSDQDGASRDTYLLVAGQLVAALEIDEALRSFAGDIKGVPTLEQR